MRRIFSPYHEKVAPYEFHWLREKEERISWQQQSRIAVRNIFLSNHSTYFSMRGMSEFVCDCKCDCFEGTSISSIPKLAKSLGIRFMDNLFLTRELVYDAFLHFYIFLPVYILIWSKFKNDDFATIWYKMSIPPQYLNCLFVHFALFKSTSTALRASTYLKWRLKSSSQKFVKCEIRRLNRLFSL